MNIIFINPPSPFNKKIIRLIDCSHETKANYLWQPNDFMIMSSLLQPEDRVTLIDGTADVLTDRQYFDTLDKTTGDLLVFALSAACWESDYSYFLKTKKKLPDIPAYVIGDIFLEENYQRLILQHCSGIIVNPYQVSLLEMARVSSSGALLTGVCSVPGQSLFPKGKRAVTITSRTPRHELFLKKGYRFPFAHHFRFTTVTSMWGCPFTCTYCTDSHFPPIIRNYHDVLAELDYVARLGVTELFFADKVFGFSPENVYPILDTMAARYTFSWSCYFNPQLYTPRLIDAMKSAGCHTLIIGIDSADIPSLRIFKRYVEPQKVEKLIEHAKRIGLSICGDFILGLQHETENDVRRTIDFALCHHIDFASFNIAAPLPGSDIRSRVQKAGRLTFGKEGFDTCARAGIIGSENISVEKLRALRRTAFRKFYLRPTYWLARIKKTVSPEHFVIQFLEILSMLRKYS